MVGKSSSIEDAMPIPTPPVPKSMLLVSPATGCCPDVKAGNVGSIDACGREAGATVTQSVIAFVSCGGAVTVSVPDWQDCTCRRRVSLLACQHERLSWQEYWPQCQRLRVGQLTGEQSGTSIASKRMDAHVCGCEHVSRSVLCGRILRHKTRRPVMRYEPESLHSCSMVRTRACAGIQSRRRENGEHDGQGRGGGGGDGGGTEAVGDVGVGLVHVTELSVWGSSKIAMWDG